MKKIVLTILIIAIALLVTSCEREDPCCSGCYYEAGWYWSYQYHTYVWYEDSCCCDYYHPDGPRYYPNGYYREAKTSENEPLLLVNDSSAPWYLMAGKMNIMVQPGTTAEWPKESGEPTNVWNDGTGHTAVIH